MTLSKQKSFTRADLLPYFSQVFDTKLIRKKLQSDALPCDWAMSAFIDGPLTFVVLEHPCGQTFTGWSKFNPNDNKYTEHGGLFKALQKAVDKYAEELAYSQTWGVSSKESVTDEVCSNNSSGISR